jgi:hypothetical protein
MEESSKEVYLNISYNNETALNFEEMFKVQPLKIVGACFACVSMPIISALCYGIIWFERFGSGHYLLLLLF